MAPRDNEKKVAELVQKLRDYDPSNETLTIDEARDLIKRSGMLLFSGWEIRSSFLLNQIKRQERYVSFVDTNVYQETKGFGFNVDAKTLAIWSLAPEHDKPT